LPDRGVGSDNATTRPKASRPLDITIVRINGGRLSFAGSFGGVTIVVPMRPFFLAGRIASVAPGALFVHSEPDTGQASLRGTCRAGRLWTKPDPNPNVKDK
jgi:hypothetical protein